MKAHPIRYWQDPTTHHFRWKVPGQYAYPWDFDPSSLQIEPPMHLDSHRSVMEKRRPKKEEGEERVNCTHEPVQEKKANNSKKKKKRRSIHVALSAPVFVMEDPTSRCRASSYKTDGLALRKIFWGWRPYNSSTSTWSTSRKKKTREEKNSGIQRIYEVNIEEQDREGRTWMSRNGNKHSIAIRIVCKR